jgi:hypothetical protein
LVRDVFWSLAFLVDRKRANKDPVILFLEILRAGKLRTAYYKIFEKRIGGFDPNPNFTPEIA